MNKYINYNSDEINKWAKETLTTEELAQYQSALEANNLLWQSHMDKGLYTLENFSESIHSEVLDANIEVIVGYKITTANGVDLHSLERDSNYINWITRFNNETGKLPPGPIQIE